MSKEELNEKISKADENSRNKLIDLLTEYGYSFEYKKMDDKCKFDLIIKQNNRIYLIEQKHRNNYDFNSSLFDRGLILNFDKLEFLINEYEKSNHNYLPVYTSTFDKNNTKVIVWYSLNKLPYSEIKQCYDELTVKLNDRIEYLQDLGEEPNKYNLSHITNKWCTLEWIRKVYEDKNSPVIPQIRLLLPLPNENNKYGKIMKINEEKRRLTNE